MTRIPTLDGWRAIAILMVLVAHFRPLGSRNLEVGTQGVGIFFVLSGYLITTNLFREWKTAGKIDLRAFYIRRFFRLMPAAWIMLLFVSAFGVTDLKELVSCVFFWRNYLFHPRTLVTSHFWSLSIEEQFYLVWPASVLLLGPVRARNVAGVAACGFALWRFLTPVSYIGAHNAWGWTQFHADALLVGCFFALTPVPRMPRRIFWLSLVILAICVHAFPSIPPFGESILIGWMVDTTAQGEYPWLDWRPLAQIGVVSYSIYLWQTPFTGVPHGTPLTLVGTLLGLAATSALSFYCIERPTRRIGAAISGSQSSPPPNGIPRPTLARLG
jgi:peptidoglycan/LPS O-acetylase OafA/YrhL